MAKLSDFDKECSARVKAYQRQEREERRIWTKANQSHIRRLKRKLFAIGGNKVSPQPNYFIELIVSHGEPMPFIMREMEPSRCHHNVSELWLNRRPRSHLFAVCTGYGFGPDNDMWRSHSWALSRTGNRISIIETTMARDKYFGIALTGEGADMFSDDSPESS